MGRKFTPRKKKPPRKELEDKDYWEKAQDENFNELWDDYGFQQPDLDEPVFDLNLEGLLLIFFVIVQRTQILDKLDEFASKGSEEKIKALMIDALMEFHFFNKLKKDVGFRYELLERLNEDKERLQHLGELLGRFLDSDPVHRVLLDCDVLSEERDLFFEEEEEIFPPVHLKLRSNLPFAVSMVELLVTLLRNPDISENMKRATETMEKEYKTDYVYIFDLFSYETSKAKFNNPLFYTATGEFFSQLDVRTILTLQKTEVDFFLQPNFKDFMIQLSFDNIYDVISAQAKKIDALGVVQPNEDDVLILMKDLVVILLYSYFLSFPRQKQFELLNSHFGMKRLVDLLNKSPALYKLEDFIQTIEFFYESKLIVAIEPYIQSHLKSPAVSSKNKITLLAYYCLAHSRWGNEIEGMSPLSYFQAHFPSKHSVKDLIWQRLKKTRTGIGIAMKLLFVLGYLAVLEKNRDVFEWVVLLFEGELKKRPNTDLKVAYSVQLAILYRLAREFEKEEKQLYLTAKILKQTPQIVRGYQVVLKQAKRVLKELYTENEHSCQTCFTLLYMKKRIKTIISQQMFHDFAVVRGEIPPDYKSTMDLVDFLQPKEFERFNQSDYEFLLAQVLKPPQHFCQIYLVYLYERQRKIRLLSKEKLELWEDAQLWALWDSILHKQYYYSLPEYCAKVIEKYTAATEGGFFPKEQEENELFLKYLTGFSHLLNQNYRQALDLYEETVEQVINQLPEHIHPLSQKIDELGNLFIELICLTIVNGEFSKFATYLNSCLQHDIKEFMKILNYLFYILVAFVSKYDQEQLIPQLEKMLALLTPEEKQVLVNKIGNGFGCVGYFSLCHIFLAENEEN